jgi:hypothetical protein
MGSSLCIKLELLSLVFYLSCRVPRSINKFVFGSCVICSEFFPRISRPELPQYTCGIRIMLLLLIVAVLTHRVPDSGRFVYILSK